MDDFHEQYKHIQTFVHTIRIEALYSTCLVEKNKEKRTKGNEQNTKI